jgi:hypothetical protein
MFSLDQLLAQPIETFIKRLTLTRLTMANVFGRTAPGFIIDRVAIRPQA